MASERAQSPVIDTHDLTELLRQQPLPAPFKLAIYSTESGKSGLWESIQTVCRPTLGPPPCGEQCFHSWREIVGQALKNKSPVVRTCPKGFIGFALPFPRPSGASRMSDRWWHQGQKPPVIRTVRQTAKPAGPTGRSKS